MMWRDFIDKFPADTNHIKKGQYNAQGIDQLLQTLIKDNAGNWCLIYNSKLPGAEQPLQERLKTADANATNEVSRGVKYAVRIDIDNYIPYAWINPQLRFVKKPTNLFNLTDYTYVIKTMVNPDQSLIDRFQTEAEFNRLALGFGEYIEITKLQEVTTRKIIIPYVEGENLADVIDFRILDPRLDECRCNLLDALNIAVAFLKDLVRLHALGIWHLDLKPLNIKIFNNMTRIIDFGMSVKYDDADEEMVLQRYFSGTFGYAPPEFLRQALLGEKLLKVNARSDVFSAGMIICDLIVTVGNSGIIGDLLEREKTLKSIENIEKGLLPCCMNQTIITRHLTNRWMNDAYFTNLIASGQLHMFTAQLEHFFKCCTDSNPASRYDVTRMLTEMEYLRSIVCQPVVTHEHSFVGF